MKTYIIAEIGPNHNGNMALALEMIKKLSSIGVDAIKFQKAIPEKLYSDDSFKVEYQKKNDNSKSPIEMSRRFQLTYDEHMLLSKECKKYKVDYICSAFDLNSLKFIIESANTRYIKIPSGEIFSIDLIEYIAKQNKKIVLSTGMATYKDIEIAIERLNSNFSKDITILHCISNYPTPPEDVNLKVMLELKKQFGYPVGFSDHTEGNDAAIAAVALGAVMIEKHVTTNTNLFGPDHKSSITIEEFAMLVNSIRRVEKMLGSKKKTFSVVEQNIKKAVRKSIVANKFLSSGHIVTEDDICFKRPGTGILPIYKNKVIGKKLNVNVLENRIIKEEYLD